MSEKRIVSIFPAPRAGQCSGSRPDRVSLWLCLASALTPLPNGNRWLLLPPVRWETNLWRRFFLPRLRKARLPASLGWPLTPIPKFVRVLPCPTTRRWRCTKNLRWMRMRVSADASRGTSRHPVMYCERYPGTPQKRFARSLPLITLFRKTPWRSWQRTQVLPFKSSSPGKLHFGTKRNSSAPKPRPGEISQGQARKSPQELCTENWELLRPALLRQPEGIFSPRLVRQATGR